MSDTTYRASLTVYAGGRDMHEGVLLELRGALQSIPAGSLIAIEGGAPGLAEKLEVFGEITGHRVVRAERSDLGVDRMLLRKGDIPREPNAEEKAAHRLWLYTNYDCNLDCSYCCVRSSPRVPSRRLSVPTVRSIAEEAPGLGYREMILTGGEPFLREDLGELLAACTAVLPTTVLTNGMLLPGPRGQLLRGADRDRLTLQVSLDGGSSDQHDCRRGRGTWRKAWEGIRWARDRGFHVRAAATLESEAERRQAEKYFTAVGFPPEDRLVRPVAWRGRAVKGLALARGDLVPELTLTAQGAFWHPVGADDLDFRIAPDPLTVAENQARLRTAWESERAVAERMALVFRCS